MDDLTSIRRSLQLLCLIAVFATAFFAKDLLLPILLGFLLALTLSPVARAMTRTGLPNALAAVILAGAAGTTVVAVAGLSAGTVAAWSDELPQMGSEISRKLRGMAQAVEEMRDATEEVEKLAQSDGTVQEVEVRQPGLMDNAMSTIARIGGTLAVTLILAMFLLASGDLFYLKLMQSFQTFTGKKRALRAVYDVERRVSRYLFTITMINAGLGLAIGSFLALLGLPGAAIFGIAAFLLNYLPFIGGVIGSVLVAAYAIVTFDSVGYALLAPLGYQILTALEGQILTPWLVGRRLELNVVAVFLTVVIWGWLWGISGALVAVPFLVVFKVVCDNVTALQIVGNFLDNAHPQDDTTTPAEA